MFYVYYDNYEVCKGTLPCLKLNCVPTVSTITSKICLCYYIFASIGAASSPSSFLSTMCKGYNIFLCNSLTSPVAVFLITIKGESVFVLTTSQGAFSHLSVIL